MTEADTSSSNPSPSEVEGIKDLKNTKATWFPRQMRGHVDGAWMSCPPLPVHVALGETVGQRVLSFCKHLP